MEFNVPFGTNMAISETSNNLVTEVQLAENELLVVMVVDIGVVVVVVVVVLSKVGVAAAEVVVVLW